LSGSPALTCRAWETTFLYSRVSTSQHLCFRHRAALSYVLHIYTRLTTHLQLVTPPLVSEEAPLLNTYMSRRELKCWSRISRR
jgi:hypothetical protein